MTESRLTQTASRCHADEELIPRGGLWNPFSCFLFSPEGMKTSKVATTYTFRNSEEGPLPLLLAVLRRSGVLPSVKSMHGKT